MAGFKSTVGVTQVRLDWDSVTNATQYKVYRNGISIGTTNKNFYYDMTVTPNSTYSYYVNSVVSGSENTCTVTINVTTLDNININKMYDYPDISTIPTVNLGENIECENLNLSPNEKISVNYSPQDTTPAYTVQKHVTSLADNITKTFESTDRANFIIENDSEIDFISGRVQIKNSGGSGNLIPSYDINFFDADKSQYIIDSKADILDSNAIIKSYTGKPNLSSFAQVWYVDPMYGNDTTGTGTSTLPYATINKAITSASNGHAIYLKKGVYNPTLVNATLYSSGFSVFNIENKNLTFIGEGKDTKVIRTGSGYSDTRRCYMIGYYQSTCSFYNINFIMSGANNFTNTYASVFCQGLYTGSNTSGQTASNISFYNCSITSDLTTSNCDLIMYFCKTEAITLENCFIDLKNSSFTTPHYYYATTGTHIYKNVAYKVYNNGTVGSSLSLGTINDTTCLTTFTYDTDFHITSTGWENTGTGTNPDGTIANIGLYGGTYCWALKTDMLRDTYITTGTNQINTSTINGIYTILTTQTIPTGTRIAVIPPMTNATTPTGYIASASSNYDSSYLEYRAFDQTDTNYWCTPSGKTTGWLAIELPSVQTIYSYSLKGITGGVTYNPKNWTFEGYNGSSWVVLDTRTGETFTSGQTKEYTLSSSATYNKYRINISANNGATYVGISEFQLYATPISTIKYLVSFDNKITWKAWNGSAWLTVALANINSSGMTKAVLEGITSTQWSQIYTPGTLDIAVGLYSDDVSTLPSVDKITICYTPNSALEFNSTTSSGFIQQDSINGTTFTSTNLALKNTAISTVKISPNNMTSNTAPAPYVASASTEYNASYLAKRAFDGVVSENNGGWQSSNGKITNQWIQLDLGSVKDNIVKVRYQNDLNTTISLPKNIKIQYSNDNASFNTIYTGVGSSTLGAWVECDFSTTPISARYVRLYITDVYSGTTCTGISEMEIYNLNVPAYYVTTGINQINSSSWSGVSKVITNQTEPTSTTVRYLVSFDNKVTWKAWNGSAWNTINLENIHTSGMSKTTLESITQAQWGLAYVKGTLDFAVGLKLTSGITSPTLTQMLVYSDMANYLICDSYVATGTNQLVTTTWKDINHITVNQNEPTNTTIRYLVSCNNKSSWKCWTGSEWTDVALSDIVNQGMTKATLESITQFQWGQIFKSGTFDYAIGLKTTDSIVTPYVASITIDYINNSGFVNLTTEELAQFTINHITDDNGAYVTTELVNSTVGTQALKLIVSTLAKAGTGNYYMIFANPDGSYTCIRTQNNMSNSYCTFSSPNIINVMSTGELNTFRYEAPANSTSWGYVNKTYVSNDIYYLKPNAQLVYSNYNLIDSSTNYIRHLANTAKPNALSTQDITIAGTGVLRTNIADMQIGDYIACKYATSGVGVIGGFTNLGGTVTNQIPLNGHTKPDGYFYFIKVAKGTLVADRVIQTGVSWRVLNTAKQIQGLYATLGGINCLVRSIGSGICFIGVDGSPTTTNAGLGAFPTTNEWDRYVKNNSLKGKITPGDDRVWHFNGVYTYGQDTPSKIIDTYASYYRTKRGFNDCSLGVCMDSDDTMLNCGFRPVLEYKEDNTNLWY